MRLKITTNAKMVRKGLEDLGAEIPKIGRQTMYDALLRVQKKLKQPGKKPTYPIPWDSIRQRKAFFATEGFGGGIPYVRTGEYQKGFQIRALPNGHALINKHPATKFIGGDARGQVYSGLHKGRYPIIRDVVDEETAKLPSAILEHIQIVARRKGFKTR